MQCALLAAHKATRQRQSLPLNDVAPCWPDRGRRVANVVAETPVVRDVRNSQTLEPPEATEPDLYHRVLFALGRRLTDRLRRATAELGALT